MSLILETNTYDDELLEAELLSEIIELPTSGEVYDGEYTVVPKAYEQELETKDKLMKDNVTIKKIPYHEVSNGTGTTVIIADI